MNFEAGVVIYAKDPKRLASFYAEVLGLRSKHEEQDHIQLQSGGFELVIVAIPGQLAEQIQIASPPVRREDTAIKFWLAVPSIAKTRERAAALGGELNPPEREWQFGDWRVCDGHDPEGNVFQAREKQV